MIELKEVTKKFNNTIAVDNISLKVKQGEVLGFLGPNGAGKTTTMRLITGFLAPDSGSVIVDNMSVEIKPVEIKKRIGYLPEDNPLYTYFTAREYLNFIAAAREVTTDDGFKKLTRVCGINEIIDKSISQLSRGYRQRVGLAATMLHDPMILILDEPTSGLDPNQIAEIRSLIKELGKEKTVILSTHILSEVEATCDRVIIIDKGRIVGNGTVKELTTDVNKSMEEVFRELTLGSSLNDKCQMPNDKQMSKSK
ncbi:ATP-binding cassette domain-containing protein [Patescibacteria group bacterium]|nr:ATP-binding cassette domain-containing protein [Patescibacteria group bacterium]